MTSGLALRHQAPNPHAHFVHAPGKRLLLGVTLDFVRQKVAGRGGRSVNAALNLTSYIDFLLVTVIFLLMSFSASGAPAGADIALPSAENGEDMVEAPMIAVNGQTVMVDGAPAGDVRAVRDAGRLGRIDALFELMRRKRELWSVLHPDRAFPGVALLQVDGDVEALVVKSVFQTAAVAGYSNLSFMVRHRTHVRSAD